MDMNTEIFPLVFASDELRLLTALVIGFTFGFVLERGGFGNARKLAGQFYLTDMTVFKVMFTAILVAMAGLYILNGVGMVDMARMWVNPTFMWAQVVGGFLLGVGFIMSGLCPGTAVVAAASGRWDGAVTIAGIFLGMAAFALAIDIVPGVEMLYGAGDLGVSVLPAVFGIPTLWFVLLVVVMAGAAFVGAEKVESIFGPRRAPVELTPAHRPRAKFAVAGTLVLALAAGLAFRAAPHTPPEPVMETIEPAAVAERLIAGDANLLVIDVRAAPESRFPTALSAVIDGAVIDGAEVDSAAIDGAEIDGAALAALESAAAYVDVLLIDQDGTLARVPSDWPWRARYLVLRGGWDGWHAQVLTPSIATASTVEEAARVQRQNAVAAFFSGTAVAPPAAAPPAPMPAAGSGGARPKRAGC
jgi:uncharacterized membrane protein YedE/YeeE